MECVEERLSCFTPLNAATALVWTARICNAKASHLKIELLVSQDPRFLGLCAFIRHAVPTMGGGMLSGVVWAIGKLGLRDSELLSAVADRVAGNVGLLLPKHFMKLLWGFARCGHRHPPLLSSLGAALAACRAELGGPEVCNILWALTELGEDGAPAWTELLERLVELLERDLASTFEGEGVRHKATVCPSDLIRLAVALAALADCGAAGDEDAQAAPQRLLAATANFCLRHRPLLGAADVFGLAWALAVSRGGGGGSPRQARAARVLSECAAQLDVGLAAVDEERFSAGMWALAAIAASREGQPDTSAALAAVAPALLDRAVAVVTAAGDARLVARLLWAAATLGLEGRQGAPRCADLARLAALGPLRPLAVREETDAAAVPAAPGVGVAVAPAWRKTPALGPSELCGVLWSFAAAGARSRPLFSAVGDELAAVCGALAWGDLADALWALASTDVAHPRLFEAAARRALQLDDEASAPAMVEAVRLAWALTAALDQPQLQADAVRSLLPPHLLAAAFALPAASPPPAVWLLLQQVLWCHKEALGGSRQEAGPGAADGAAAAATSSDRLLACASRAAFVSRGGGDSCELLRREVAAVLAGPDEAGAGPPQAAGPGPGSAEELSQAAGRARLPVDVALPRRRLALDAECPALTVLDAEEGKVVPSGVAQLRRHILRRDGWALKMVPQAALSAPGCRAALREMLAQHPPQRP